MNKRAFLKATSALIAGGAFSYFTPHKKMDKRTNWAGNLTYSTDDLHIANSIEEVQKIIKKHKKLRGLGTCHSFNSIADSTVSQVSMKTFDKIISLDKEQKTVTVEAGIRYGQLAEYLHKNGFALHNLASLPHISVGGACSTATHGSGIKNGNLATAVSAIEFVDGMGNLVTLSRQKDAEKFNGSVVGLGSLGLLTKLTLDVQPTFNVQQAVYQNMPMKALEKKFISIMSSGYSVSLFTDWQKQNINQVWIKSKVEGNESRVGLAAEFHGAKLATKNMHPLEALSAENCTEQMGVVGPWYERLPHFKMGFTPSSGKELQTEYFVPIERAYEAMMAIEKLNAQITPHLFITEIRTAAADNLWLSPCYKQTCAIFHFTWKQEWEAVKAILPKIEAQLTPFKARPHWGKLFTLAPKTLQSRLPKLPEFKALIRQYDPEEKFKNEFIATNLYG